MTIDEDGLGQAQSLEGQECNDIGRRYPKQRQLRQVIHVPHPFVLSYSLGLLLWRERR